MAAMRAMIRADANRDSFSLDKLGRRLCRCPRRCYEAGAVVDATHAVRGRRST